MQNSLSGLLPFLQPPTATIQALENGWILLQKRPSFWESP